MNLLYWAKPYDRNIFLRNSDDLFLRKKDITHPGVSFDIKGIGYSEKWVNKITSLLEEEGIYIECIYPLVQGVSSYVDNIDYSIPIIQPFKHARYMPELMRFNKIIFPDGNYVERLMPHGMIIKNLYDKAIFLEKDSGPSGIFTAIFSEEEILPEDHYRFYENASELDAEVKRLAKAIKSGDYSDCLSMKNLGIDIDA